MPSLLQNGQTLLCIGDSITDGDRRDPAFAPLGRGYVRLLHDLLVLREPAKAVTVINRGIGGNTADDLRSRWHEDALLHRPDALVLKIGINDLNQFLCNPEKPHADRHGARFVDLHALFQERLRLQHPNVYCPEPVHPNATGHLVIADAVYNALCD